MHLHLLSPLPLLPILSLLHSTTASALPHPQSQSPHQQRQQDPSTCLAKSLSLKTLKIANTYIDRGSPFNRENTTVSFTVANPAVGTTATCSASAIALTPNGIGSDPYVYYPCTVGVVDGGENGLGGLGGVTGVTGAITARFQYDATLNFLTVDQSWGCVGGDGS